MIEDYGLYNPVFILPMFLTRIYSEFADISVMIGKAL